MSLPPRINSYDVGDEVTIVRKPKQGEPLEDYWTNEMDAYIGASGKIINITQEAPYSPIYSTSGPLLDCIEIEHPDGNRLVYPYYCIAKKVVASVYLCNCKTEVLIAKGCRCGAFSKEKAQKKI